MWALTNLVSKILLRLTKIFGDNLPKKIFRAGSKKNCGSGVVHDARV
jgi:hypothetical protein